MKNYFSYYTDFERPPFAPTFYPTEDEFADPIAYVAKIKSEAEKYGVVKIKPPPSFRPPFAISSEQFNFIPRIQKLNHIEALTRSRLIFNAQLSSYWHLQGHTMQAPHIDGKCVDLYDLYTIVLEAGGACAVTTQKHWNLVARRLGLKQQYASKVKKIYFSWIDVFLKSINENEDDEDANCKVSSAVNDVRNGNLETGIRGIPQPRTKSMAGLRHHIKEKKTKITDPMDEVVCKKCGKGDDEEYLLLCEDCDHSLHTYCCTPALQNVPKAEWRCHRCVMTSVKEIPESFAFYDAQESYNLITFAKYANDWKKNYFQKNPQEVSSEEVEKEFWKNVIDLENTVAVKYGADLLVTKVGSGFPMNGYDFGGVMDCKERDYYANHPWNLNNLPVLKDSVLSHMGTEISGMMVPWVYVGMCFSAFCWHTEDHWTYSINYMHWGERKIWYGVSGNEGEKFDKAMVELVPYLFERQPDLLHHMTTTMNPKILIDRGIHVYTVHQEPGDFVITFPRSYHAGYNEGLNFAEAVNFAPPDWLRKGRMCIIDYARVRRSCVFSHEELMVKMVKHVDKLSIAVRVAVHEELYEIIAREKRHRELLSNKGVVESAFIEYENIPDDFRTCVVCKTTLFMSSLSCKHNRLVCLEHASRVCKTCSPSELIYNYRYTPQELISMYDTLCYHIREYTNWRDKLMSLIKYRDTFNKPSLEDLRVLMDISRVRRFPRCDVVDEVVNIIKQCDNAVQAAQVLLSRRVCTRNSLRKQMSVYQRDTKDIENLWNMIQNLPCTMVDLEVAVKNYVKCLSNWRERCASVLDEATDLYEKYDSYIDSVSKLIDEANDFNVNLAEINDLEHVLVKCQWLQCTKKLLALARKKQFESESDCFDEEENEQSAKGRWKLQNVMSLIEEGAAFTTNNVKIQSMVDDLHVLMKLGYQNEYIAESFLSDDNNGGKGIEGAEKLWLVLKHSDWMTEENIDKFRREYILARNICSTARSLESNGNCTLKSLNDLLSKIENSFIMLNSVVHKDIEKMGESIRCFCTRIGQMFMLSPSYYNMFEILSGRDDLANLVEGSSIPLNLLDSNSLLTDWFSSKHFTNAEQLEQHVSTMYEQQRKLMLALRRENELRPLAKTCLCGSSGAGNDECIRCLLCHAKFHSECVRWNSFMLKLPVGYYMCMRCLRSPRPFIEDVKYACTNATLSLESVLVRTALKHAELAYKDALELIDQLPSDDTVVDVELLKSVDECLISVFCNEMINSNAWELIVGALTRVMQPTEKEKEIYEQIKIRPILPQISDVLFATNNENKKDRFLKRSLAEAESVFEHQKRIKNDTHNEQAICSALVCLNPYSEHIRWIQCEMGCARWYHYVCVGQTVAKAQYIRSYCCYRCSTVSQFSVSPTCSSLAITPN